MGKERLHKVKSFLHCSLLGLGSRHWTPPRPAESMKNSGFWSNANFQLIPPSSTGTSTFTKVWLCRGKSCLLCGVLPYRAEHAQIPRLCNTMGVPLTVPQAQAHLGRYSCCTLENESTHGPRSFLTWSQTNSPELICQLP